MNWYLTPNIRTMFNYVHAKVDDRDLGDGASVDSGKFQAVQGRFQVDF